jgi:hypothetical protein
MHAQSLGPLGLCSTEYDGRHVWCMSMHACMALYNKGHRQHGMSIGGPTRTNVSRKEPSIGNKKERKVGEGRGGGGGGALLVLGFSRLHRKSQVVQKSKNFCPAHVWFEAHVSPSTFNTHTCVLGV